MAGDNEKNILKEIWPKEQALREKLLPAAEAESLQKGLIELLEKDLPKDSLPELRFRKILRERRYQTWWADRNGYPTEDSWEKIKPFLDILEQYEAEKTIKRRFETEGLFVESRSRDEDLHLLVGEKDGSGDKAHLVIDGKTGEIRVEENRLEPTDLLDRVEAVLTLRGGKKIRTTREAIEEIDVGPTETFLIEVEQIKVSFNEHSRTKEGLADSFSVSVPILLKNLSKNKLTIRNIKTHLEVPSGYSSSQFHSGFKAEENINAEDLIAGVIMFTVSIDGRWNGGANSQNPIWEENKHKLIAGIASVKFIFKISAEYLSVRDSGQVEKVIDLSEILIPHMVT